MFTSTELAARIEGADAAFLLDCVAAAETAPGSRAFARRLAGGVGAWTAPGAPMNKVAGLGFDGPLDEAELAALEDEYAARDTPVQVELCHLAESSIGTRLTARGYGLVGYENVSGRALVDLAAPPPRADLVVETCEDDDLDAWVDLVATGFAAPDEQGLAAHESFPREVLERAVRDLVVVTTQPGSKSQENVQRQGFDLLYTRAMLVRPAPAPLA